MSSMNLNLLPSKAKFQAAKIKLQAKIRLAMIIITSVWVFVVAGLMTMNFVVKIKMKQVKANGDKVQQNYLAMQDSIVSSQRFKYKTKMVGEVLHKRFEYGKAFETVTNMFPAGVVIKNIDLRLDGVFEIRGETQGKSSVDQIENLANANVELKSLTLKGGVWNFIMEVKLK